MSETYEDRAGWLWRELERVAGDYERPVVTMPRRTGKTEALRRVQEWYEGRRD